MLGIVQERYVTKSVQRFSSYKMEQHKKPFNIIMSVRLVTKKYFWHEAYLIFLCKFCLKNFSLRYIFSEHFRDMGRKSCINSS